MMRVPGEDPVRVALTMVCRSAHFLAGLGVLGGDYRFLHRKRGAGLTREIVHATINDPSMSSTGVPTFPAFTLDDHCWTTSANLPAWAGHRLRLGSYGDVAPSGRSDGIVSIRFAPGGRDEAPLSEHEVALVRWVIDHDAEVHEAVLDRLFQEYPTIREESRIQFGKDEAKKALPKIRAPRQLRDITTVLWINVHCIDKDGIPFIGVELGCTWDAEHGIGILLHGSTPLELGGADTAFLLWIAKKYVKRS